VTSGVSFSRLTVLGLLALCASCATAVRCPRARRSAWPAFEPFADVVCRVEVEAAKLIPQRLADGGPGPVLAKVVQSSELRPWLGTGVFPRWPPSEYEIAWQRSASAGKVLMLTGNTRPGQDRPPKGATPCAQFVFRVPEDGRYYLFMRGDSWCCGCQSFVWRLDDGPDRELSWPLWEGWGRYRGWKWQPLAVRDSGIRKQGTPVGVPTPIELRAGEHHLDIVWAAPFCYGLALDELVVARQTKCAP